MQSEPRRLVMENLGTSSPLLPPHQINNTLIYYLHFEAFVRGNLKARGEGEINCPPPLSVFNYSVCSGSSVCQRGALWYLCQREEMKPRCFEEIKQCFSVHDSLLQMQNKPFRAVICMAFEDKENYISLVNVRFMQP